MNVKTKPQLSIQLLGKFHIHFNESFSDPPKLRRKTRALIAYLAASPQTHRRQKLIDIFCNNADSPTQVLRLLLSRIRRQLGADIIVNEDEYVYFNHQLVYVDCLDFTELLTQPLSAQPLEKLERVLALYQGEFLEGLNLPYSPEFELWRLGKQVELQRLYEQGMQEILERLIAQKKYNLAIRHGQAILNNNPLIERVHEQLVRLYMETGQYEVALRQFEQCRQLLQREMNVEPSASLLVLYEKLTGKRLSLAEEKTLYRQFDKNAYEQDLHFIGRTEELRKLTQVWGFRSDIQPGAVLIKAEAGGGKTRLIKEFLLRCEIPYVVQGRCHQSMRNIPYHPWIDMLEAHLAQLSDEDLQQLPDFVVDYLARLLPMLAHRLERDLTPEAPIDGYELRHLFLAVAEFLNVVPAQFDNGERHVIFVDDLQWADASSLQLSEFLIDQAKQKNFILIGACRIEWLLATPWLLSTISELESQWQLLCLKLRPFTSDCIVELIEHTWHGLAKEHYLPMANMILQATGGNPFFASEIVKDLRHTNRMPAKLPVSATIQEFVTAQLHRFSEHSQQVIEAVAVFDAPMSLFEAQFVSKCGREDTAVALKKSVEQGFLKPVYEQNQTKYDLRHDLIREVVLNQLNDINRTLLHYRVAIMLHHRVSKVSVAERQAKAGQIVRYAAIGEHYKLVHEWAGLAIEYGRQLNAFEDAINVCDLAMLAYEQLQIDPQFEPDVDVVTHIDILLQLAWMNPSTARPVSELKTTLDAISSLLKIYPNKEQQALYLLCKANYLSRIASYEDAITVVLEAQAQYETLGDLQMSAFCLARSGHLMLKISQNRDAKEVLEEALIQSREIDYFAGESYSLSGLSWVACQLGNIPLALKQLNQALKISRERRDLLAESRICFTMLFAWSYYYAADKLHYYGKRTVELCQQMGFHRMKARAEFYIAVAHYIEGNILRATALCEETLTLAIENHDSWLEGWAVHSFGRIIFAQGDYVSAERCFRKAWLCRQQKGDVQNEIDDLAWLGRSHLMLGKFDTAVEYTAQAIELMENNRDEFYVWETPNVLMCHAETLAAIGEKNQSIIYLNAAYNTLKQFADNIQDLDRKRGYLKYPLNKHILQSWEKENIGSLPILYP